MDTKELVIELALENSKLKAGISEMESQLGKAKKSSGSLISSIKAGWLLVAAAVASTVAAMKKMVSETIEAERNQNKLVTAMKNQGIYSRALLRDYNDQAKALQGLTTYQDDEITLLQAQLTQFGLHGKALKDVTAATLDFAASQEMNLMTAGTLVGKTIGSDTNALSRYGATAITAKDKTERAAQAVSELGRIFGGQAQAAAMTFEGKLKQINNQGMDFIEEVGRGILIGLNPLISKFQEFSRSVKGMEIIDKTAKVLSSVFVVAGAVIGITVNNLITSFKLFGNTIETLVLASVKAIKGDLKGAVQELKGGFNDAKSTVIDWGKSWVDVFGTTAAGLKNLWTNVDTFTNNIQNKAVLAFGRTEEEQKEIEQEMAKLLEGIVGESEEEKLQIKLKALQDYLDKHKLVEDEITKITQAQENIRKQIVMARFNSYIMAASQVESGLQEIYSRAFENQAQAAENAQTRELNALEEKYNKGLITEEDYNSQKDAINKKYEIEAAKRKRKQAEYDKAASMAQAIINTAEAVAKALTAGPVLGPILAGMIGALGAAQVALIAAQPLPEIPTYSEGGAIDNPAPLPAGSNIRGEDGIIAVRRGESVLNQAATAILGRDAIDALNAGRGIYPNVNLNIQTQNGSEVVYTLNKYFRQFGTSARGVAM